MHIKLVASSFCFGAWWLTFVHLHTQSDIIADDEERVNVTIKCPSFCTTLRAVSVLPSVRSTVCVQGLMLSILAFNTPSKLPLVMLVT